MSGLWKEEYKNRLISAAKAATMLQSGDSICGGTREAKTILSEVGKRTELKGIKYYSSQSNFLGQMEALGDNIRPFVSFMDDVNREFVYKNWAEFIPCGFSGYGKLSEKYLGCRVAFPCVSAPNKDGYVSFGNSADMMPEICSHVPLVIAEINRELPFVHGANVRHVTDFDFIVEGDGYPLNIRGIDDSDENRAIYQAIGANLSGLVEDEATLEVGIGRLNSSAMMYLENKKDLGIHTEIFGDLFMELTKKGMVNNCKKTLHPGVSICTQVVGSGELFDYVDNNLSIGMHSCQYVLNPGNIARNRRMTAINNAVQIDLLGQANAEYLKGKQYSGMGGIADFSAGATLCPEGKSIVVVESITKNGKFSKIVPCLEAGVPVSLTRTMIEYVVTEYGVASLGGKTVQERAKELILVAHPKFREELAFEALKLGIIQ